MNFDLNKALEELLKPTDPPKSTAFVKNTTEASISIESIVPTDPPEDAAPVEDITEAPMSPESILPTDAPDKAARGGNITEALNDVSLGSVLPTDPPEEATLKTVIEAPSLNSVESILPRLPPEGVAWLNGLNPFCRRAVEHDLRTAGPGLFVKHWESLRDTLQRLERDLGPSDGWK